MKPWTGVDFDGTLATYESSYGPADIGEPIHPMVNRVIAWLAAGKEVRIVTARVYDGVEGGLWGPEGAKAARRAIEEWCVDMFGRALKVQCHKDGGMVELWDDRAREVETNTGRSMSEVVHRLLMHCPDNECVICGTIICPHGEPLHFHHDGCPACTPPEKLATNAKHARSTSNARR